MLLIGFHPTPLNFKGKKGKIPLLLTNNSSFSDHWAGNLSLSRSCSLATECCTEARSCLSETNCVDGVWMWEGKEGGKLLPPSPPLSWEDGLYGFVGFGNCWDREGLTERVSASIPTWQLGKVERSNNLPKISSTGQQQGWG